MSQSPMCAGCNDDCDHRAEQRPRLNPLCVRGVTASAKATIFKERISGFPLDMVIVLLFLILCHGSFCKLQSIHQVNLPLAVWDFGENLRLAIIRSKAGSYTHF